MNLLHLFEFIILKMDEPRFMVLETALLNPFELEIIGDSLDVGSMIVIENQCDEKLGDIVTLIGIIADGGKAVELLSIFVIEDLRVLFLIIGKIIVIFSFSWLRHFRNFFAWFHLVMSD